MTEANLIGFSTVATQLQRPEQFIQMDEDIKHWGAKGGDVDVHVARDEKDLEQEGRALHAEQVEVDTEK